MATVFVLWILFNGGGGSLSITNETGFITEEECNNHAKSVKTLMLQPKYVKHVCVPKTIYTEIDNAGHQ